MVSNSCFQEIYNEFEPVRLITSSVGLHAPGSSSVFESLGLSNTRSSHERNINNPSNVMR